MFNFSLPFDQQTQEVQNEIYSQLIERIIISTDQELCGTSTLTTENIYRPTCVHYETENFKIDVSIVYIYEPSNRCAFAIQTKSINIQEKI